MTAKEYLLQISRWQRKIAYLQAMSQEQIKELADEMERLYNQASGLKAISYDKDHIQISPENTLEAIVIQIEELAADLNKALTTERIATRRKVEALQAKIKTAKGMIEGLQNEDYARVLTLRYVEGKRWEEIACLMNYSYRHITRIHGQALAAFTTQHKDVLLCPKKS